MKQNPVVRRAKRWVQRQKCKHGFHDWSPHFGPMGMEDRCVCCGTLRRKIDGPQE